MDLTKAAEPRSDQMNAEDLLSGPRTFTITAVTEGSSEQPVNIYLSEYDPGKPFKPSKTVIKLLILAWGPESDAYIGRRFTLYCEESVKWAGKPVGGIRVSHMSHIKRKIVALLSETKGKKSPHTVEPLPDELAPPHRPAGPLDGLVAAFGRAEISDKAERLGYCRWVVERDIGSARDLTAAEVQEVVEALDAGIKPVREPAGDAEQSTS